MSAVALGGHTFRKIQTSTVRRPAMTVTCPRCGGKGKVHGPPWWSEMGGIAWDENWITCGECRGIGAGEKTNKPFRYILTGVAAIAVVIVLYSLLA